MEARKPGLHGCREETEGLEIESVSAAPLFTNPSILARVARSFLFSIHEPT